MFFILLYHRFAGIYRKRLIGSFNAVVESNTHARHLYERLGFTLLGTIPEGFLMKDGHYENICVYYQTLKK